MPAADGCSLDLPTVVAIAVGRWFHAFFGQHNAIDEHETDLEFQARDATRNSFGNAAQFSQRRRPPSAGRTGGHTTAH